MRLKEKSPEMYNWITGRRIPKSKAKNWQKKDPEKQNPENWQKIDPEKQCQKPAEDKGGG